MRSTCSSFVYCWNARQLSKQRYPKLGLYRSEFEHPIGHAIQNIIVVHPSLFRCEIDQPQMRRCQVENSVCIGIALWLFYLVLFIGVQLWEIQILRKYAEAEIDFTRRRIQHQLRSREIATYLGRHQKQSSCHGNLKSCYWKHGKKFLIHYQYWTAGWCWQPGAFSIRQSGWRST
jgi:hypothetical protein